MTVVQKGENDGVHNGTMKVERLLDASQMNEKCKLYARCTLSKNATLSYHSHFGETETYFILSGEGIYDDNGERKLSVKADDVLFCKSGNGHAITNSGDTELIFMALILTD